MHLIVYFLGILTLVHGYKPGIRVKWSMGDRSEIGKSYFISIPSTRDDSRQLGWKQFDRPEGPLSQLVLYCPDELTVCVLYDDSSNIAGLQIAVREDEFTTKFDWRTRGFTKWIVAGINYWTVQQYFVSEEYYNKNLVERVASRDNSRILQQDGIWASGINGDFLKIPKTETEIQKTLFTKQACKDTMGLHYFYNMSATTECTAEALPPWFSMFTDGELLATAFFTFGKLSPKNGHKAIFEIPNAQIIKQIMPRGPECVYNLAEEVGLIILHIFYVDDPWNIKCSN